MTAKEKFEARLEQLGLLDEWNSVGSCGRVAKFDDEFNIILLVHEGNGDQYSEIWYLPFDELRDKDNEFVKRCWDLVRETEDGDFARDLALWLMKKTNKDCPLHPTDAYFLADENEYYHTFENDDEGKREEAEYQTFIEETSRFCGWMEYSLGIMRPKLIEAIKTELKRGHNVPWDFRIEGDYSYFCDYYMDFITKEQIKFNGDRLVVECVGQDGEKEIERFDIDFDFLEVQDLLLVYENMK